MAVLKDVPAAFAIYNLSLQVKVSGIASIYEAFLLSFALDILLSPEALEVFYYRISIQLLLAMVVKITTSKLPCDVSVGNRQQ